MKWNVYYYDINQNKITTYNVFDHYYFIKYFKEILKECKGDKECFADRIKSELRYYFWSRSEWELIIEITENNRILLIPWCGCRNPQDVKIDVTEDTSFDWRSFAEYHIGRQIFDNNAKIDVYNQIMFNWDAFLEYVLENI